MFLKAGGKSYNVSLANMKGDTSSTFNKSQLYFYCFDVDCHNPPPNQQPLKVQIYPFTPPGPAHRYALTKITEVLSGLC